MNVAFWCMRAIHLKRVERSLWRLDVTLENGNKLSDGYSSREGAQKDIDKLRSGKHPVGIPIPGSIKLYGPERNQVEI